MPAVVPAVYCISWLGGSAPARRDTRTPRPTQALRKLATQPISIPGERGFALEGITERPANGPEGSNLRQYFRQCREEICVRLLEVFYTPQGMQSRYWLDIAVRCADQLPRSLPCGAFGLARCAASPALLPQRWSHCAHPSRRAAQSDSSWCSAPISSC